MNYKFALNEHGNSVTWCVVIALQGIGNNFTRQW